MLESGIDVGSQLATEKIGDCEVCFVGKTRLAVCFDTQVSPHVVREIAHRQPEIAGFADAVLEVPADRTEVERVFEEFPADTRLKTVKEFLRSSDWLKNVF